MMDINSLQKLSKPSNPPMRVDRRQPIDVADLVQWAYQVQRVDMADFSAAPDGYGSSCVARVERIGALGVRVDTFLSLGNPVHPDAETVHAKVLGMGGWMTGCLMEFGRSGLEPDPMLGQEPKARPVLGRTGFKMIRDHNRNAIACEITWDGPDWREIEFARLKYERWHEALTALAESLKAEGLTSYLVTGPAAKSMPWHRGIDDTQKP